MAQISIDAKGLACPEPMKKLLLTSLSASVGDIVLIEATDRGFGPDIKSWCKSSGSKLISLDEQAGVFTAKIELGSNKP